MPSITISTVQGGGSYNEQQEVDLGSVSGGTFTLTFDGQTTAAIDYNATAAEVETALESLSNIDAGDVEVTGPSGGPWVVEFQGQYETTDVALITADSDNLVPDPNPYDVEVTTSQAGGYLNEIQQIPLPGSPTGGTFTLTYDGQTTGNLDWDATAGEVETALEALSNITDVSVTGSAGGPWSIEFEGGLIHTDVALLIGDATNLVTSFNVDVTTTQQGVAGSQIPVPTVAWHMDESGLDTVRADAVVDLDLTPQYDVIGSSGKLGFAAEFSTDYEYDPGCLWCESDLKLNVTSTGWSLSVWIKVADGEGGNIVYKGDSAGTPAIDREYILSITSMDVQFHTYPGPDTVETTGDSISADTWHHVVVTVAADQRTMKLYLDGVLKDTTTKSLYLCNATSHDFVVGGTPMNDDENDHYNAFEGMVDEAAVWAETIDQAAVNELYNSGSGTEYPYGMPATDELQVVTIEGENVSGGTFTLTYSGQTTAGIAYDATAGDVETALENLSNITDVTVTGSAGGPWTVRFDGNPQGNVAEMAADGSGLTGDIEVETTQEIQDPQNEVQEVTITGNPQGGTFTLTYDGQTTAAIDYDASNASVESALEALSNIDNVAVTTGSYLVEFQGSLAQTNVPQMTATSSLAGTTVTPTTTQAAGTFNAQQNVQLSGANGGTFTLSLNHGGGTQTTSAIPWNATTAQVQTAVTGMSNVGTGNATVSGYAGNWVVTFTGSLAATAIATMTANSSGLWLRWMKWKKRNPGCSGCCPDCGWSPGFTYPYGPLAPLSQNTVSCYTTTGNAANQKQGWFKGKFDAFENYVVEGNPDEPSWFKYRFYYCYDPDTGDGGYIEFWVTMAEGPPFAMYLSIDIYDVDGTLLESQATPSDSYGRTVLYEIGYDGETGTVGLFVAFGNITTTLITSLIETTMADPVEYSHMAVGVGAVTGDLSHVANPGFFGGKHYCDWGSNTYAGFASHTYGCENYRATNAFKGTFDFSEATITLSGVTANGTCSTVDLNTDIMVRHFPWAYTVCEPSYWHRLTCGRTLLSDFIDPDCTFDDTWTWAYSGRTFADRVYKYYFFLDVGDDDLSWSCDEASEVEFKLAVMAAEIEFAYPYPWFGYGSGMYQELGANPGLTSFPSGGGYGHTLPGSSHYLIAKASVMLPAVCGKLDFREALDGLVFDNWYDWLQEMVYEEKDYHCDFSNASATITLP